MANTLNPEFSNPGSNFGGNMGFTSSCIFLGYTKQNHRLAQFHQKFEVAVDSVLFLVKWITGFLLAYGYKRWFVVVKKKRFRSRWIYTNTLRRPGALNFYVTHFGVCENTKYRERSRDSPNFSCIFRHCPELFNTSSSLSIVRTLIYWLDYTTRHASILISRNFIRCFHRPEHHV